MSVQPLDAAQRAHSLAPPTQSFRCANCSYGAVMRKEAPHARCVTRSWGLEVPSW